uniref:Tudor domain-containing protein n=1 Tax=Strongyloides stercoralis TaxID=6248 RepID=A0A0K0EHD0_STRER
MYKEILQKFGVKENTDERFILGSKYRIPYLTLPEKGYFKIVKVISPSLIIVKFLNDITKNLNELFDSQYHIKLNIEDKFYCEIKDYYDDIFEGFLYRYCLAPINNNEYGRGRIIEEAFQLTDNKTLNAKKFVKVFFIDTGEEKWFSTDLLYELPIEKYLIPWQIVLVSLDGIIPSGNNIKYWNENVCQELENILRDILFVEIIKTNSNKNHINEITPVKMIAFYDSKELIGENVSSKLFCKLPLDINYVQFSFSNYIFDTFNETSNDNKKKLFDDNIPVIESVQNSKKQKEKKYENVIFEEIHNTNEIKRIKLKEKRQQCDVKLPMYKTLEVSSINIFHNNYKKIEDSIDESCKFCSPQIPIWTKHLLKKFNYIGTDNKMYLELLPFEETSYGEEIVKNPLEMHAAMLRYQPEDVVIREDILYNTLELEYYSEKEAFQNKLNFFYSQPGNLCSLNQIDVLKDLNNGYPVYGIYFTFNDCGVLIANRIEILSVKLVNIMDNYLDEEEIPDSQYDKINTMNKNNINKINEKDINIFESVKIRFLDYGGIVVVSVKMLSKIHKQFCFLPPFSIQINLIPLTQKIYSIASEENREFILQYYDYFNAAVDLKTPMLAIFDSHQETIRKKKNETHINFFENNCEWEYNHVINISNMQRLFPRGIPIDMTIDSYLNFLENNKQ